MGGVWFALLTCLCAVFLHDADVVSQLPGLDLGDHGDQLGDILGDVDGIFDLTATESSGTPRPGDEADKSEPLSCFDCTTRDSDKQHSNCVNPQKDTVTVTQCEQNREGHINHCGKLKATISNTIAGNPEEKPQIEWFYRGCVSVPNHREHGGKCYMNDELNEKVRELMGQTIKQIVGAGADSSVESEGCFCKEDLCNGATSTFKITALIAIPLALSASRLLA